jgi:CheY-like chemotaxis protein
LVNDILDLSKIEAGRLDLEKTEFYLRGSLEETIKMMGVRVRQKDIILACDIRPEAPDRVVGDPARLRQIVVNLIANAIKFTELGEVLLTVEPESAHDNATILHFAVHDTGVGIPLDKRQLIFGTFTQADSSITRRFGGTGLALTISTRLVHLMGGRIWVESELGQGSVFHFTVQFGVAGTEGSAAFAPHIPDADAASVPVPLLASRPLRVLLAEDNPVNQKLAVKLLEKRGHHVIVAGDGREALAAFDKGPFDVVLTDVQMPGMGGLHVTAAIRRKRKSDRVARSYHRHDGAGHDQGSRAVPRGGNGFLHLETDPGEAAVRGDRGIDLPTPGSCNAAAGSAV